MKCENCGSKQLVKNGLSRHGKQRWRCRECGKTTGAGDARRVEESKREAALALYLSGIGLRETERKVGVSHNAVLGWVFERARQKFMEKMKDEHVESLSAKEMKARLQKLTEENSSGMILILPKKFFGGKWMVVTPHSHAAWARRFLSRC